MTDTERTDIQSSALTQLELLTKFNGAPAQFWRQYLSALSTFCGDCPCCVVIRSGGNWSKIATVPTGESIVENLPAGQLDVWASQMEGGPSAVAFQMDGEAPEQWSVVASLKPGSGDALALTVLIVGAVTKEETLTILSLANGIPERFEQRRQLEAARRDASRLANALDLMALLNCHTKFAAAAMALCNELTTRFGCERVSIGWLESNYVALKAMSHTEKIEPQMEAVQQICALMEEACDQEEEIVWPRPDGHAFITRDHEIYAEAQGAAHLATLPIFNVTGSGQKEGETPRPTGAVTLERKTAFTIDELRTQRLMLDQAARQLVDLHRNDRWFGARWTAATREACGKLLGAEHTWWKLLAILIATGLLILIFGHKDYRVEATFALKTDAMAHLSAPFEGHIERVAVKPGDVVKSEATLVSLDTRELLLQKEAAVAERERHTADALKAESSGDVAGMRIAQAREAQARAQIDIVNDRLARAEVKAPFDGVVVESDLREKIAAPVQKGEVLLKIARIADLYLVAEVPERDIQEVHEGATGQAAFASLPGQKFTYTVERIEPVARSKDKGSSFSVHCRFTGPSQSWWRPGMTGIAKIDAGRRSLLWICTHRTTDFLRMWWW